MAYLIDTKVIQSGDRKDKIVDHIFDKSFNFNLKLALEILEKNLRTKLIEKKDVKWLETHYQVIEDTEVDLIIRVTQPYCG